MAVRNSCEPNESGCLGGAAQVVPRILVAEDDAVAGDLVTLMVRRLGYDVDRVADGSAALDAVLRARAGGASHAMVLMDAMMPAMTGSEAARRIRNAGVGPAELPIIAMTGATDERDVRGYLDAGMQGVLAKPLSLADLATCCERWIPASGGAVPVRRDEPDAALRRRYHLRKAEVLGRFEHVCQSQDFAPPLAAELRDHLHKLAGTAGSFGDCAVGRAAAEGEALLLAARAADLRTAVRRSYALLKAAG